MHVSECVCVCVSTEQVSARVKREKAQQTTYCAKKSWIERCFLVVCGGCGACACAFSCDDADAWRALLRIALRSMTSVCVVRMCACVVEDACESVQDSGADDTTSVLARLVQAHFAINCSGVSR